MTTDEHMRRDVMRNWGGAQEAPADVMDEIVRLRNACQTLGKVVTGMARSMEAARIEMLQNGPEAAMEWILNSLPDVDDNPPAEQWNGTESARAWFDRTRDGDLARRDAGNTAKAGPQS